MYYNELSATAQERARHKYLDSLDYEWWDSVYGIATEDGRDLGFYIDDIYFRGFWSQGDGASWEGSVDIGQWLKAHTEDSIGITAWVELINNGWMDKHVKVNVKNNHYCHSNCMSFTYIEEYFTAYEKENRLGGTSIIKDLMVEDVLNLITSDPSTPYKSIEDITEAIEQSARDYADEIYKKLQREYEWLCSEDVMVGHFDDNDIQFDEEGEVLCFGTTE